MTKRKTKRRSSRKRDYAAEYQRRVARAEAKGYSRSIARGHPPKGVLGISLSNKLKVPVGTEIADISLRHVDRPGADPDVIENELRAEGFTDRELDEIDYLDQDSFLRMMLDYGYTPHEAYQLYFGYH